jgi:hypothetical protein
MIWLLPHPLHPASVRRLRNRGKVDDGKGWAWRRIIWPQESLALYKSFNALWQRELEWRRGRLSLYSPLKQCLGIQIHCWTVVCKEEIVPLWHIYNKTPIPQLPSADLHTDVNNVNLGFFWQLAFDMVSHFPKGMALVLVTSSVPDPDP